MTARQTAKLHDSSELAAVNVADRLFDVGALLGAVQLQLAEIYWFQGDDSAVSDRAHAAGRVVRQATQAIFTLAEELMIGGPGEATK